MHQPNPRTASPEAIKAYAANGGHGGPAPANVALAVEAGVLRAFVDMLCDERDRLLKELQKHDGAHANATAPKDCLVTDLYMGESPVWVAYEVIDDTIEINDVYVNGRWMRDINEINEGQIDSWCRSIAERREQDAAEYEYERRQERLRDMQWP